MCYSSRGYPFWAQKKLCKHHQILKVEGTVEGRIKNQLDKLGKMVMRSFMLLTEALSGILQGLVLELGHGCQNKKSSI